MRDDHNRLSLLAHRAEDRKKFFDLLRREHGGGLVQNQQPGLAVERLQQLHALLLAHRQVFNDGVGIHRQLEVCGQSADARAGFGQIERERRAGFGAQHDVFGHRHRVDEHEMLMHHANAERDGVLRPRDAPHLPVDENLAAVGGIEAVRDAHRGGLPRAVFADDGVNRSGLDRDVDVIVRQHAAEALRDTAKFNH